MFSIRILSFTLILPTSQVHARFDVTRHVIHRILYLSNRLFINYSSNDPPTIIHCRQRRGHASKASLETLNMTSIAALSGRATALQPEKPTWNQQDSDRENCGPQ